MVKLATPSLERFLSHIEVQPVSRCWLWTAGTQRGYGHFRVGARGSKKVRAHRFAYELWVGPIPKGLTLDHLCRVRHCVNPDHLEAVTQGENVRRGDTGKLNANKTHCLRGHPFDAENTIHFRTVVGGRGRRCRTCTRLRSRQEATP